MTDEERRIYNRCKNILGERVRNMSLIETIKALVELAEYYETKYVKAGRKNEYENTNK